MHNINTSLHTYNPNFEKRNCLNKVQLRQYIEQGMSNAEIAKTSGLKDSFIDYLIKAYDLTESGLKKLQETEKKIIALRLKRFSYDRIVEETGITLNTLKTIMKNLNNKTLIINRGKKYNTEKSINYIKNNNCEVSDLVEQSALPLSSRSNRLSVRAKFCDEIINLVKDGLSIKEIAEKLNRSESNIKGYIKYIEQKTR